MRTLLLNAQIYSLAENFATAMVVDDGVIAWIGSEGGALVHKADVDLVVDLEDRLVTPGFVNLNAQNLNSAGGFVAAQVADVPVARGWSSQQWDAHSSTAVAVVPEPGCQLRSRISAGTPTALVPADPDTNGWVTLRSAVYEISPDQAVTARAAFQSMTRGAWRLLGRPDRGVLAVGAEATFVEWDCTELVVESPDERISNWSTDPRSATPGLPLLEPGAPLPEVARIWRDGVCV